MKAFRIVYFMTEECDKKCYYCDIGQIQNQKPGNFKLIKKVVKFFNDKTDKFPRITMTGGEPGLIQPHILKWFFENVNPDFKIRVNTNGLFLKNGYFNQYYDKIKSIGYHPNIEVNEKINYIINDPKITMFQPVTKQNYKDIEKLLIKYPDLNWNIIPFLQKYVTDFDYKYILNDQDDKSLIKILKKFDNVDTWTLEMLERSKKFSEEGKKQQRVICGNSMIHPTIDFVNEQILRCPLSRTNTDKYPLTDKNLNKLINWELFDDACNDKACQTCNEYLKYFPVYFENYKNKMFNRNSIWKRK